MRVITTELLESKRDERGRRITPASEREAVVRAYEASGLTQKAFARREGIKYPTLVSWEQRQRREGAGSPRPTFAELTMASAGGLEVRLPEGVVIRGASVEDVAKLEVFAGKPDADAAAAKEREKELYEEIGRLKMELEWLKKKVGQLDP